MAGARVTGDVGHFRPALGQKIQALTTDSSTQFRSYNDCRYNKHVNTSSDRAIHVCRGYEASYVHGAVVSFAKSSANSQPIASVMEAAVQALMMFPAMGIHPMRTCEAARPTVAADTDANAARAALSVNSTPKTRPRAIIMVSCTGVMMALSLHGI